MSSVGPPGLPEDREGERIRQSPYLTVFPESLEAQDKAHRHECCDSVIRVGWRPPNRCPTGGRGKRVR